MVSILVDVTKCTGCEKCVIACIKSHNLNKEKAEIDRLTSKDGLSDNRLLSLRKIEEGRFARYSCMHCIDPSCVAACLVGGITKLEDGPVIYDPTKCIGCRYCMLACPYEIPRYEWSETKPFMKKCDFCYENQKNGEKPTCVNACPNNAIQFGFREELLRKARKIINSNKKIYIDHIWGEKEFGGSSLLYISDVNLKELGWPVEVDIPIPKITEPLIEKTPIMALSVAGSLIGINWIIRRRMRFALEKSKSEINSEDKNE
jgi:formate dehydrogenase iron-sulfur subunit